MTYVVIDTKIGRHRVLFFARPLAVQYINHLVSDDCGELIKPMRMTASDFTDPNSGIIYNIEEFGL